MRFFPQLLFSEDDTEFSYSQSTRNLINAMDVRDVSDKTICSLIEDVDDKPDVNVLTKDGGTLLHQAIILLRQDLVELFLRNGADLTLKNEEEGSLIHSAITRTMMLNQRNEKALLELIELLLDKGVDVNTLDESNNFMLIVAIYCGLYEIIQLLLNKGANIDYQESESFRAPLHYAMLRGDKRIIDLLISHKPNFSVKDKEGWGFIDYLSKYHPDFGKEHPDLVAYMKAHSENTNPCTLANSM